MKKLRLLPIILALCVILTACGGQSEAETTTNNETNVTISTTASTTKEVKQQSFSLDSIPEYNGKANIVINDNIPFFTDSDMTTKSFEKYSNLDSLGRCGVAYACVGQDIMPTTERGAIGQVKPSGWHTVKYDNVDGKYLYNRCHLIGYQLSAENANEKNLITGTRYLNIDGMLEYENEVADYVKRTNNHVLYRVTPMFNGDELVCRGLLMEAFSVEDNGKGVKFNIYCYNVQPDIEIDYKTGDSHSTNTQTVSHAQESEKQSFIVNTNTKKFHKPTCQYVDDMSEENKKAYIGYRESLINNGFVPCKSCNP